MGAMQQRIRRSFAGVVAALLMAALIGQFASAQDSTRQKGRKYKDPPPTARVVVTVVKATNGKPIHNAAVVFHSSKGDKDDGNLEMKTDEQGKASIDVIPMGSKVEVQVIADGYATFGEDYELGTDTTKAIIIKMKRPQGQYSAYTADHVVPGVSKPGVQEPAHSATPTTPSTTSPTAPSTTSTTAPASGAQQK